MLLSEYGTTWIVRYRYPEYTLEYMEMKNNGGTIMESSCRNQSSPQIGQKGRRLH